MASLSLTPASVKRKIISIFESHFDRVFLTKIHTAGTEDTFTVLHLIFLYHFGHVQTHGAVFCTAATIDTLRVIRFQLKGRIAQLILDLGADHHERRHPANRMAGAATADGQRQNDEERNDNQIDDITFYAGNGNAVVGFVKKVDASDPPGGAKAKNNGKQPGHPNEIFDPIHPVAIDPFIRDGSAAFLQTAARADPSAKGAAKKEREQKQSGKHQKTAGDDPLETPGNDQNRRKIKQSDREKQKGNQQ